MPARLGTAAHLAPQLCTNKLIAIGISRFSMRENGHGMERAIQVVADRA
jgi:hypothetical protein